MATFFLVIIYLSFISLGLPDSMLGAAWPVMHVQLGVRLESAGLLSMVIAGGTIVSSLSSGNIIKKLGTGKVTFISCLMTASALLGFSLSPSLVWLVLLGIPLGLGAGSVDAALNNYVATHYKAHHMSWLHCFWGVGATLGPIIMSGFIGRQNSWRSGYFTVSVIQYALAVLLFFSLPLWNRGGKGNEELSENTGEKEDSRDLPKDKKDKQLKSNGIIVALISFLFYCGAEITMGLWGSSFLVGVRQLSAATAAQWVSMYYAGITAGRFISGFITMKVNNKNMIRIGQCTALAGTILLVLPLPTIFSLVGFVLTGLGFAPIYPCMLHETPVRFGKENSQRIMGIQMAVAYTGSTILPPLLGLIMAHSTMTVFPFFVFAYILMMLLSSEGINLMMKRLGV